MENNYLKLADIPTGEECVIVKVHGHGSFRNRIVEMGFVKGEKVTVIKNAPLHDPIEYKLMDGHISLRRSEARLIEVVCTSSIDQEGYNGTFTEDEIAREISEKSRTINIALVGNPNCGKTSFFNRATGLRERVGNYSGVTVDAKQGTCHHKGYTINLIDLPGTYSITEYTPEEIYVREFITKHHPDLVLNVVDASCLERNLFLTTQLIDMNIRVVMALNMFDELTNEGSHLDYAMWDNYWVSRLCRRQLQKGSESKPCWIKLSKCSKTRPKSPGMYILIMGQKSKRRLPGLKWRSPRIKILPMNMLPGM